LWAPAVSHPGIDEQIADVTRLIKEEPKNATLYLRRGELHRIHRDWATAEADYRKALALDSELTKAEYCLGRLQLESGNPKDAERTLARYLSRHPDDVEALVARGRALSGLDRPLEAAQSYASALTLAGEGRAKPDYYLERARALSAAGPEHLSEALRCLDEGLARLGEPASLQSLAIELELSAGRHDQALARLDALFAGVSRRETWLVRRGEILEDAGRPDAAREAYSATLAAIATLPETRRHNRAVAKIEERARDGLERLDAGQP
jgi:predicted Zn-dependent protease